MKTFTIAAAAAALAATAAAAQEGDIQVGELRCELTDRSNLVITSKTTFDCTFRHAQDGETESYVGTSRKIGLDLTMKSAETLIWFVFAPSVNVPEGALAGGYVGASAEIAAVYGVGAKILLGGSGDAFALQPAAVAGEEGYGAALALEEFVLEKG